jgi:hypothetical protein
VADETEVDAIVAHFERPPRHIRRHPPRHTLGLPPSDTAHWLELSEGRDAGKRLLYWEAVVGRWGPTAKEEVLDQ